MRISELGEDIWVAVLRWEVRIFRPGEDIRVAVLGLAGEDIWRMRIFGWQF